MLGVAAPLLVSIQKHRQAAEPGGSYAAGRWLLWLHVNWLHLSLQVLSPLIVTVGLVLLGAELDSRQGCATFFLAGYGADSLAAASSPASTPRRSRRRRRCRRRSAPRPEAPGSRGL